MTEALQSQQIQGFKILQQCNKAGYLENFDKLNKHILYFKKAIALDPKNKLYRDELGKASIQFERLEQQTQVFEDSTTTYFEKGLALQDMNLYEEAIRKYNQCINQDPKYINAYNNKGLCLQSLKKFEEAIEEYNQCILLDPNYTKAYFSKGLAFQSLNKYEQAIIEYKQCIKLNPGYTNAYFSKGLALQNMKQYNEAIKEYDECIKLDPKQANAYLNKGNALQSLNLLVDAIKEFNLCIEINPKYTIAYNNKGLALHKMKQFKEAIQEYNQCIKIDPKYTHAYNNKGLALQKMNQFEEAVEVYNQCIKLNPKFTNAYLNKGLALQKMNQYEDSIKEYNQCIKLDQKYINAYYNKGNALKCLNKFDEAIKEYDQCIYLDPKYTNAYLNKGNVFQKTNQFEEAMKEYELALKSNVKHILTYVSKSQVEQQLGLKQSAIENLNKARQLLDDPSATKELSSSNLNYIKRSVDRIIQLKTEFEQQAVEIENALQDDVKFKISAQLKDLFLKNLKDLTDQKQKILDSYYEVLSKPNFEKEPTDSSIKELIQAIQQLMDKVNKVEQINFDLDNKIQEHHQIMQKSGLQQSVKIKESWLKYKTQSPRLYDYQKSFYWTLVDYFNSYRIANTGVIQSNTSHTEDAQQQQAVEQTSIVLKIGAELACGFPLVGSIFSTIDKIIGSIYGSIKSRKFDNRVNAMMNIIRQNQDPDAQSLEDFNNTLALAALEIVDRKYLEDYIGQQMIQKKNYFAKFINKIQVYALGEKIELYSTKGGKEALDDILLLLIHMTIEHKEVIRMSSERKLYLIIADAVMQKKSIEVLDEMPRSDQNLGSDTRSCIKCSMM